MCECKMKCTNVVPLCLGIPVESCTCGDNPGGGVTEHGKLTGRDAVDQHPKSAITNLEGDLEALDIKTAALETGKQDKLIAGTNIAITGNVISAAGGGGGAYIGKFELHLRPPHMLPQGWIFAGGMGYQLGTPVGDVLDWLRQQDYWQVMEAQWTAAGDVGMKIGVEGNVRYVPNWCFTDGRGPAMRALSKGGTGVGRVEEDASRELTGTICAQTGGGTTYGGVLNGLSGAFQAGVVRGCQNVTAVVADTTRYTSCSLAASRVYPTADEVRVLSRLLTPAIFIGVQND